MKRIDLKVKFLGLVVATIAASTGILTACSTNAQHQAQAPSPTVTDVGSSQPTAQSNTGGMNHGGMMDHSMMDLGPADADFDLRFIDSMIPHHEGAVVMAKEVLQKSQRPEMKKLAEDIIKAQTKEIAAMKRWRTAWYPKAPITPMAWHAPMGHMMAMSEEQKQSMMMSMDLGIADAQFDLRFLNAMIPHHEGALVMAKDVLNKSQRPEMKQLAKNILTSQQQEIDQMQQWRKNWYGK